MTTSRYLKQLKNRRKLEWKRRECKKGVKEMEHSFQVISDLIAVVNGARFCKAAHFNLDLHFSWKQIRKDIIDRTRLQKADDCWTYGFSRAQSSLIKRMKSKRKLLSPRLLKYGVNRQFMNEKVALYGLHRAIPFMKQQRYVDQMLIHRRPKTGNSDENFESLLKKLLVKSPVAVSVDVLPSYQHWDGQGIYTPTDIECEARKLEKFVRHVLLVTGHGVSIRGGQITEYVEMQDSKGEAYGDKGFVKLALHKRLIKQIIELKVGFE